MKSFKQFRQSLSEVFQGTRSECMKMCRKLGHSQEECEKRWCSKSNVSIQEEERSDSRKELDAYRAHELRRQGVNLETIFKSTGGYRQSVVDAKTGVSAAPKKDPRKKNK